MNSILDQVTTVLKRWIVPTAFWPRKRVVLPDLTIELWVCQRKLPMLLRADAIVVPTAPDLKMVFGIAKMVRDMGADAVQYEANAVAPLEPGDAFVGTGAKFRYKYTALTVIFDESKRTSAAFISESLAAAMRKLREKGARSVVVPDYTENLLTQPNWITTEQRQQTAAITSRLLVDAILTAGSNVKTVRIWVWDPANASYYVAELDRLKKNGRQAVTA